MPLHHRSSYSHIFIFNREPLMTMPRLIIFSVLLCVSHVTIAADPIKGADCSSMQDAKKRLKCYDTLSKNTPAEPETVSTETYARKAVLDSLKDPDSARFGKFTEVTSTTACLNVNARNAFGGYTGDQVAFLLKADNKWVVVSFEKKLSHAQCIEVMSKNDN